MTVRNRYYYEKQMEIKDRKEKFINTIHGLTSNITDVVKRKNGRHILSRPNRCKSGPEYTERKINSTKLFVCHCGVILKLNVKESPIVTSVKYTSGKGIINTTL